MTEKKTVDKVNLSGHYGFLFQVYISYLYVTIIQTGTCVIYTECNRPIFRYTSYDM